MEGTKVIKAGAERAVGYIDEETAREKIKHAAIRVVTTAAGGTVTQFVDSTTGEILVRITQKGVEQAADLITE